MLLPRGRTGKDFIIELTRLINLFVYSTPWETVSISLVHIFIPLMLQKPAIKSKARANSKYLSARLEMWENGDLKGYWRNLAKSKREFTNNLPLERKTRLSASLS